jgi:hypothetical protein
MAGAILKQVCYQHGVKPQRRAISRGCVICHAIVGRGLCPTSAVAHRLAQGLESLDNARDPEPFRQAQGPE